METSEGATRSLLCSRSCHRHMAGSANHRSLIDACLMSKIHLSLLRDEMPFTLGFHDFLEPGERMERREGWLQYWAPHTLTPCGSRTCYAAPWDGSQVYDSSLACVCLLHLPPMMLGAVCKPCKPFTEFGAHFTKPWVASKTSCPEGKTGSGYKLHVN